MLAGSSLTSVLPPWSVVGLELLSTMFALGMNAVRKGIIAEGCQPLTFLGAGNRGGRST